VHCRLNRTRKEEKMPKLQAYHRPETVAQALKLLHRKGVHTTVLGGGTRLVPALSGQVDEVVDLQAIGLDQIVEANDRLTLGAMVRLQSIVENDGLPKLLRTTARRAGPNTFRNQETVGGTIVAVDSESEFLAALLVYEAEITVQTLDGNRTLPLAEFLDDVEAALGRGLLTAVSLTTGGETAHARVARTPQDTPIVAAVARRTAADSHLALCGVGSTPLLLSAEELDTLQPPADFRGSSEYRKEMARVLTARVLARLDSGA
jgi:CO/xanthine dehydrogenase FAD-binding subunit